MATNNEQFARACNQLERLFDMIEISIHHDLDHPACIKAHTSQFIYSHETVIHDEEMDVDGWRQFGKSIKTSDTIKTLLLQTAEAFQGSTPEIARCIRALFEEVKENKSIYRLVISFDVCSVIPVLDLRYFFQNDPCLSELDLFTFRHQVSLAESNHLHAALRDLSLKKLRINCSGFTNNGGFDQVLFACRKMEGLSLLGVRENYQFRTISNLLRDPMTSLKKLYLLNLEDAVEMIENEILASLARNVNLQVLEVYDRFQDGVSKERIKQLLCNTASIESIIRSNHSLRRLKIYYEDEGSDEEDETNEPEAPWQQYLELNENPNKNEVIQAKIMQFYFSGDFDTSSITNMPPSVLTHIMGIDVQDKQSAIFNILKSIPELCSASSSDGRGSQSQISLADGSVGCNKRQKTDT